LIKLFIFHSLVIRSQRAGIYKLQLKPCELSYNTSSLLKDPLKTPAMIDRIIAVALDLINPSHLKKWFTDCC
jgi:hypothetical protein